MHVPFLDLKAVHDQIGEEIERAIAEVVATSAFAGGPFVERFEQEFADYCGTRFCVGVGSGTEALWFSLLGLGIGPGDEVITVANTFIATVEAISMTGARPVLVDVVEDTATINPELVERAITDRTKAIIPVHLYGLPADMDRVVSIANENRIPVVEDAAQAHGAESSGRRVGSIGAAGCFSFYPGKNLGAYGEGGAVVTSDATLAERVRALRDHGQRSKYYHEVVGWNGRMDGIQAAVLSVKLRYLDSWNARRRTHAERYTKELSEAWNVRLLQLRPNCSHAHHLFVIRTPARERLLAALKERGIGCGIHYPVPIHQTGAYSALGYEAGAFPVSERLAREVMSLPIYPHLSDEQRRIVSKSVHELSQPAEAVGAGATR